MANGFPGFLTHAPDTLCLCRVERTTLTRVKRPEGTGASKFTPEERAVRSRIAAHVLHSKYDSKVLTANGRKAFLERFEKEVDPEGKLPEAERKRRAEHARKAYFSRLGYLSGRARRARGGAAA